MRSTPTFERPLDENLDGRLSTKAYPIKPVLRWAGSKTKLLRELIWLIPNNFTTYFEPFLGSGVLFFALGPERAVLSDFNGELCNFYTELGRSFLPFDMATKLLARSPENYDKVRDAFKIKRDSVTNAVRFYYLNRLCFNGVYRENKKGHFNVPMGSRLGKFPSTEHLKAASQKLSSAEILNCDFKAAIERAKPGDFVYLDPPYSKNPSNYGEYGYGTYTRQDESRLFDSIEYMNSKNIKFLLSYRDSERIRKKFQAYEIYTVRTRRQISSSPSTRGPVSEVLIKNYNA